jgi:hypothetical protein
MNPNREDARLQAAPQLSGLARAAFLTQARADSAALRQHLESASSVLFYDRPASGQPSLAAVSAGPEPIQ